MAVQIGYFNSSGLPAIKIRVSGAYPQVSKDIDAVIDTGFDGFLSMPLVKAFPLGLPLAGASSITLADGKLHEKMIAMCNVLLGDQNRSGMVILEPASRDVLIGMTFLNIFKKTLFVQGERKAVALIDNADADSYAKTLEGS